MPASHRGGHTTSICRLVYKTALLQSPLGCDGNSTARATGLPQQDYNFIHYPIRGASVANHLALPRGVNSIGAEMKQQLKNVTKLHCNKLSCEFTTRNRNVKRSLGVAVMLIESESESQSALASTRTMVIMVKRKMKKLICRGDGNGGWRPLPKGTCPTSLEDDSIISITRQCN